MIDWAGYLEFRSAFAQVMDERYYTIDWLDACLLKGEMRFWATAAGAIVAEIKTYPTGAKDVCGVVAAGDLREIIGVLIPQAEEWGRSKGCLQALIKSRPEWGSALAKCGYAPQEFTIYKDL